MRYLSLKAIGGLLLTAALCAPAWGDNSGPPKIPNPGTLNYVEGQASLDNQTLNSQSVGVTELQAGQLLTTGNGKAEILLTPGVFLREGDNSTVRMISPTLTNTEVSIDKGQATVEVDDIYPQNNLLVDVNGATTVLAKRGLYGFNADRGQVMVIKGQAFVRDNNHRIKVSEGHAFTFNSNGSYKAQSFDKNAYEASDLYRWSSLRSEYLAEANVDAAPDYMAYGGFGPGWYGAGWYWDPWFFDYTFIPGDGIFYSPFGWGFYSPFMAFDSPIYWGGGHYYHNFAARNWGPGPHYAMGARGGVVGRTGGGFRGGFHGGGIHSGGIHGGGFHGGGFGGGGFHGGGGGGGHR